MERAVTSPSFTAIDLGATSGRVILGRLDDDRLHLKEVYRFRNGGVRLGESLHWDVLHLWSEVKTGLHRAATESAGASMSIGLDTWGVDFGLLAADDTLIGNPYHYRDGRTDGMLEEAFSIVPKQDIYKETGIQFMQINSLYQLLSMAKIDAPALAVAETFLNMPDLFNFFLTGRKANELTISSTTQCSNPKERAWSFDLLSDMGIPTKIFGEIIQPGTPLGKLHPSVVQEVGASATVIAIAGHDTASAVAAVPSSNEDYIFLSSGTWSLLGIELDQPNISQESMEAEMTNEGGVNGKIRFLRNIIGLWLVQECRRRWRREGNEYAYDDLTSMAEKAHPLGSLVIPGDKRFLAPEDMPTTIQGYCRETKQAVPQSKGAIVRCALESLALEYRWVAEQIDRLTETHYPLIHIIGGGVLNKLLNQFTANSTGRIVIAGPVEAAAIGNILVQAVATGNIASLSEGRALVKSSFDVETYEPEDTAAWDVAYERYLKLRNTNV